MSMKVLSATTLALLIGVNTLSLNTAVAQNGSEARSNDREMKKTLDDKHLTPVRPIRRVGEDNWPAAKDQPRETTGQAAKTEKTELPKQDSAKQEPAKQEPAKQDIAKQQPAKPEQKQDTAKQESPKQDVVKQDATQNNNDRKDDTAKNGTKSDKSFASIRLGTDAGGRVAVNDAQQRDISTALRKHRIEIFDVKVSVGSVAPTNVRIGAVSADIVAVLPQFRGYSFFATREEIVIVEPRDRKVVALIPVKPTATASAPAREERTTTRTTSAPAARTVSRERDVTVGRATRTETVGRSAHAEAVPTEEEILAAPVTRGPAGTTVTRTYRTYQYVEEPSETVIIQQHRRPRLFGLW
jgi:hypothetical protein